MKIKRIIAGISAICLMGVVLPSAERVADSDVITASAVDATEGTYELLTYKNYGDYIKITGCDESATEVVIPSEIEGLPVTSIGERAFFECYNLTAITIPDSITSIENSAFLSCDSLTSVDILASVENIGSGVFEGCMSLILINVAEDNANYSSENGILFNKDKTELIKYPVQKPETEYAVPESVTKITGSAFSYCKNLTSVSIPYGITKIESYTFYDCESLKSVEIPDSVTIIGENAFVCCKSLTSISIPESVTTIEKQAFCMCSGLTSIDIPDSVTNIGINTFAYSGLTSISIPESITTIPSYTFRCTEFKSIEIPEHITSIGEAAFGDCDKLESITILNPDCEIYDNMETFSHGYNIKTHEIEFDGIIYGYDNSTAQTYAEKNYRKFVSLGEAPTTDGDLEVALIGDANCDGKVTIADATAIIQYIGNPDEYALSAQGKKNADSYNTGDGVTGKDANAIQMLEAGLITSLSETE